MVIVQKLIFCLATLSGIQLTALTNALQHIYMLVSVRFIQSRRVDTLKCSRLLQKVISIVQMSSYLHRVTKKNCAKLFLSEVRQMSTNCDNLWHTDSTKDRFM